MFSKVQIKIRRLGQPNTHHQFAPYGPIFGWASRVVLKLLGFQPIPADNGRWHRLDAKGRVKDIAIVEPFNLRPLRRLVSALR